MHIRLWLQLDFGHVLMVFGCLLQNNECRTCACNYIVGQKERNDFRLTLPVLKLS